MATLWVNGIVSASDKQPYVQLSNDDGIVCQMSMAQARNLAMDILQMSARTEADAMIFKFFTAVEFPDNAAASLMSDFRDFRAALDDEAVIRGHDHPHWGTDTQTGGTEAA